MNPYVKSIQFKDDYCLLLAFENGEKRIFDLKPYFDKPVFAKLKNVALFKTARVVSGSVEWQGDVDLSYDTLYLESTAMGAAPKQRKSTRGGKKGLAMVAAQKRKLPKVRAAVK
jgi:hypothetical protein